MRGQAPVVEVQMLAAAVAATGVLMRRLLPVHAECPMHLTCAEHRMAAAQTHAGSHGG